MRLRALALSSLFPLVVPAAGCRPCCPQPVTTVIDFEHYPGSDGKLGTADDVATPTSPCPPAGTCILGPVGAQYAALGIVFTSATLGWDGTPAFFTHNHLLTSEPVRATLTTKVYGIEITSYSDWDATLTAYDGSNRVLALANLWHPSPGTGSTSSPNFHQGELRICTTEPIRSFSIQADTPSHILNLDRLVLVHSHPD
jgi:hypothetical protein